MAGREQLHALVDSLPEGALESAQTYLNAIQTWPPKRPELSPEVEKFRKELEDKRQEFLRGGGPGTGYLALDRSNKTTGSFSDSEFNRETGETTLRTFRVHHDFPWEITERLLPRCDPPLAAVVSEGEPAGRNANRDNHESRPVRTAEWCLGDLCMVVSLC